MTGRGVCVLIMVGQEFLATAVICSFVRRVLWANRTVSTSFNEIVGTSPDSWEDAARTAIETASKRLGDLRVAEVVRTDVTIEDGGVALFRTRLNVSFKYESD